MVEPNEFETDAPPYRIVTKRMIADMYARSSNVRIIRSGVYGVLGHCGDCIRQACKQSEERKEFRIILPSLTNGDVRVRSVAAGKIPEEVFIRIADWHEVLAQLAVELSPRHSLELRTTELPHRYHAIFSDTEGFAGPAFHFTASLTTRSIEIGRNSEFRKWLIEDFETYWDVCQPYHLGDNKKRISSGGLKIPMNPVLLEFGRAIPSVIATLKFIKRGFPDANGNGATKEQLSAHTGNDPSDCNKRMLEMERAGFLFKLGGGGTTRELYGRLLTKFGEQTLQSWEQSHGKDDVGR